jgi:6-pyruvoyltetrahydropterin/6-carboxytetrahydropterin synthase
MALQLNRTYRFKFYLNANHYIIINGVEGETHPHTWEFTIDIMIKNDEFVEFNTYEKSISEYFAKYQNGIMNNFEPFDTVIPTLENMSEAGDAKLIKMESSETPTRSYIISFEEDEDFKETIRNRRKESMDAEIDAVVDRIAQKKED